MNRVLVRSPHRFSVGGVDGGECDRPVNFGTWASQVDDFKKRLGTIGANFDKTVDNCKAMPPDEKSAWYSFYFAFKEFITRPSPTFGSYQEWLTTCTYAKTLDAWQIKIEGYGCQLIGPRDIHGADTSIVKWGTAALIAGVVGVGLVMYGPSIAAGVKSLAAKVKR